MQGNGGNTGTLADYMRYLGMVMPARFPGIGGGAQLERPPSWVDQWRVSPEEGGTQDTWTYDLPRIRGSENPQSPHWPRSRLTPEVDPNAGARMPSYDPFGMWGIWPWTHLNAPWRRPQGL